MHANPVTTSQPVEDAACFALRHRRCMPEITVVYPCNTLSGRLSPRFRHCGCRSPTHHTPGKGGKRMQTRAQPTSNPLSPATQLTAVGILSLHAASQAGARPECRCKPPVSASFSLYNRCSQPVQYSTHSISEYDLIPVTLLESQLGLLPPSPSKKNNNKIPAHIAALSSLLFISVRLGSRWVILRTGSPQGI